MSKCVKPRQMSKKVTIPVFHVGVCFIYVTNYVMTIKLRNLMARNTSLCTNIKNDATANLPESKFCNGIYKLAIKVLGYTSKKKPPTKSQFAQTDDKPKGLNACF